MNGGAWPTVDFSRVPRKPTVPNSHHMLQGPLAGTAPKDGARPAADPPSYICFIALTDHKTRAVADGAVRAHWTNNIHGSLT